MLAKTQKAVAEMAGLSEPTVKRFEGQNDALTGHSSSIAALRRALEAAGIVFLGEGDTTAGGPGVRLSGLGLPVTGAQNRAEGNDNQAAISRERQEMND